MHSEFRTHRCIVPLDELLPGAVSDHLEQRRRGDDVGKEEGALRRPRRVMLGCTQRRQRCRRLGGGGARSQPGEHRSSRLKRQAGLMLVTEVVQRAGEQELGKRGLVRRPHICQP